MIQTLWYLRPTARIGHRDHCAAPGARFIHNVRYAILISKPAPAPGFGFDITTPARRALGASQIRSQATQHPRRYPATPAGLPPNKKPPAFLSSLRVFVAFKPSKIASMALRAMFTQ